jgi:cytidylate kinase
VGFDEATLGDAAEDLAAFALAAELDESAEEAMLNAYLGELDELRRPDAHFVSRYFARRALLLFSIPIARLARMTKVKRGDAVILRDPVVEIEEEAKKTYEELSRAMNGLRDLGGRARPVGANEVAAMGRLVAIEEMILHDRTFRIAVSGRPYVGKTEVASQLARRLRHRFVPTTALSRGLALAEQRLADQGRPAGSLREAVTALFAAPFSIAPSPEPPFYKATLAGADVTQALHAGGALAVRAAALLDDDELRVMLRDALHADIGAAGVVVEGPYAHALATSGGVRAHAFHLDADDGVRRARLSAHRADLETDDAAAELLARLDDASAPPPQDAVVVDVGSRTAAAATLELLWHLLPPGRRPQEDLTGRTPL